MQESDNFKRFWGSSIWYIAVEHQIDRYLVQFNNTDKESNCLFSVKYICDVAELLGRFAQSYDIAIPNIRLARWLSEYFREGGVEMPVDLVLGCVEDRLGKKSSLSANVHQQQESSDFITRLEKLGISVLHNNESIPYFSSQSGGKVQKSSAVQDTSTSLATDTSVFMTSEVEEVEMESSIPAKPLLEKTRVIQDSQTKPTSKVLGNEQPLGRKKDENRVEAQGQSLGVTDLKIEVHLLFPDAVEVDVLEVQKVWISLSTLFATALRNQQISLHLTINHTFIRESEYLFMSSVQEWFFTNYPYEEALNTFYILTDLKKFDIDHSPLANLEMGPNYLAVPVWDLTEEIYEPRFLAIALLREYLVFLTHQVFEESSFFQDGNNTPEMSSTATTPSEFHSGPCLRKRPVLDLNGENSLSERIQALVDSRYRDVEIGLCENCVDRLCEPFIAWLKSFAKKE